jgi:prepilin-type N-terminal cleavage/methylation domain-containing protein
MRGTPRPAFTLLEILLAMAIGLVLMSALYMAMDLQLKMAQTGRDAVEQGNMARNLLSRVASDIASNLGPAPKAPKSTGSQGGGGAAAGGNGSGGGTSTGTGAGVGGGSSGAPTSGGDSSQNNNTAQTPSSSSGVTTQAGSFNLGVTGDSTTLILYSSQVPREITWTPIANSDGTASMGVSDLRRISYWLVDGGDGASGLARQEVKLVTSDDAMSAIPPDIADPQQFVVAEEVKSLKFSYFDGTSWQDSWDGTTIGADSVTPIGPPAAIAIEIGISFRGSPNLKQYRHVVAILPANGLAQQSLNPNAANLANSNDPNAGQ